MSNEKQLSKNEEYWINRFNEIQRQPGRQGVDNHVRDLIKEFVATPAIDKTLEEEAMDYADKWCNEDDLLRNKMYYAYLAGCSRNGGREGKLVKALEKINDLTYHKAPAETCIKCIAIEALDDDAASGSNEQDKK